MLWDSLAKHFRCRGVPDGSREKLLAAGVEDVRRRAPRLECGGICDRKNGLWSHALRTLLSAIQPFKPALTAFSLQQNDSVLSAICGCQSLIPRTELCRLFDSGSLPDFSHSDLSTELGYLLSGASISYEAIKAATASATTWVAGAFRIFSVISLELPRTSLLFPPSSRAAEPLPCSYPASSVVTEISTLWSHIDRAHAAIQRLRQTLSEIDGLPGRTGGALSAVEDHVLLAVTMDIRLISLVHLIHRFLEGQDGARSEAKEALMVDSWLRVRKCLKLLS